MEGLHPHCELLSAGVSVAPHGPSERRHRQELFADYGLPLVHREREESQSVCTDWHRRRKRRNRRLELVTLTRNKCVKLACVLFVCVSRHRSRGYDYSRSARLEPGHGIETRLYQGQPEDCRPHESGRTVH